MARSRNSGEINEFNDHELKCSYKCGLVPRLMLAAQSPRTDKTAKLFDANPQASRVSRTLKPTDPRDATNPKWQKPLSYTTGDVCSPRNS